MVFARCSPPHLVTSRYPSAWRLLAASCLALLLFACPHAGKGDGSVGMAVEYMDHAAAAYVAHEQGVFVQHGLKTRAYRSYGTGMALAAALARDDIDAAYLCLVPAICAYANAKVPLKVVAGTHRYGYALVVNPWLVTRVEDLARDGLRIGSVQLGGAADLLLNRALERAGLDRRRIVARVRRMGPPKLLRALRTDQLDAAFLPMQWATMAEEGGLTVLLTGKETWPGMPGSVLVVKSSMLEHRPGEVRALVAATQESTAWINRHAESAAEVMVRALSLAQPEALPGQGEFARELVTAPLLRRSMSRLEYTLELSEADVDAVIAAAVRYGYINQAFPAREILDTRFVR